MQTNKFKTRQEFRKNMDTPKGRKFVIGLDIGYSAVKCFYEKGYFCFPSYVRKLDSDLFIYGDQDILYRDLETGNQYIVGRTAMEMISSNETNITESEMFSRNRYRSKNFKILCNLAIAFALECKRDEREIVIQTGLPSAYEKADTPAIKKALMKPAHFQVRIGKGEWKDYNLSVEEKNIFVMPQPSGSLYSALIRQDGTYTPDAKRILFSNTLVMDIGFGTFDYFGIKKQKAVCKESIDDVGMKQVLKETSTRIMDTLHEEIRVPALQSALGTGVIVCTDMDEMKSEEKPLAPFLEDANNKVFHEAIESAYNITGGFVDYNFILVTGGTGEAWLEKIKDYFSGLKTVKVMTGNENDHLPMIYSNARGYYMYRYMLCGNAK
nr:ParM/StbA family protein [uncultured Blautia sp.]